VSAWLARRALALYPLAYRRRYGDEMAALVEEGGASPSVALDLAKGAVRAHRLRLLAATALVCWLLFAAAIFAFAKTTEEPIFRAAASAHPLIGGAHLALQLLSVVAGAALLLGAVPLVAIALPQVRRRPGVRRATLAAGGCVVVAMQATAAVVLIANQSPEVSSQVRTAALVGWIAIGLTCALGCALAARRGLFAAELPDDALRLAGACAAVVIVAMVGIALATAVYLAALLADAPSLASQGNGPGGLLSVGASIAIFVGAMVLTAGAGSASALRARRARLS
jgi:hypothetical protein